MADPITQVPVVKVGGSPLAAKVMDDLADMRVDLSVHASGSATLRFTDADFAHMDSGKFAIGADLVISITDEKNSVGEVFSGEIVAVGIDQVPGSRHQLLVEAYDKTHRLSGTTTIKAYLKQSRDKVVKEIAGRHGLSPKVDAAGGPEPYLLQTGTDYAFLWELARSVGYEWFADGKTLHFRKRPSGAGATVTWGDDLYRFTARYSAVEVVKSVTVQGWDSAQQKAFKGEAKDVASPKPEQLGSDAKFVKDQHGKAKGKFGKPLIVGSTHVRDAKEAEAYAGSIGNDLVGAGLTVRGEAQGNPKIKPGTMLTVKNVGKSLAGKYYLTEVQHVFGAGRPMVTRFAVTGHRGSTIVDVLRSGQSGETFGSEPVVGVVTNTKDPENLGRVKVMFPTLGKTAESEWARVAAPGGGAERGLDFRPEVDDEVLVVFDKGDLRSPFVVGGLWNAKAKVPDAKALEDGVTAKRVIKSRTGHTVTLSDGKKGASAGDKTRFVEIALADKKTKAMIGEAGIEIEAAKGKSFTLKAGDASITLDDKGMVTIKAKGLTIDSPAGDVQIKGKTVQVKGATGVKIDGGTAFEAKGAQAKLTGAAMTSIKGGMVKIN
jgi:phage protein D